MTAPLINASVEECVRCGWRMGEPALNCQNDDTPHVFPSTEEALRDLGERATQQEAGFVMVEGGQLFDGEGADSIEKIARAERATQQEAEARAVRRHAYEADALGHDGWECEAEKCDACYFAGEARKERAEVSRLVGELAAAQEALREIAEPTRGYYGDPGGTANRLRAIAGAALAGVPKGETPKLDLSDAWRPGPEGFVQ